MAAAAQALFETVPPRDHLHFWSGGGLHYKEVSDFLELDKNELSKIAGVQKNSVRLDERIPRDLRERLEQIANICNLVADYFQGDPERTALWMKAHNPVLGGISPRDMIRYGRYKRLMNYVVQARTENAAQAEK